MSIKFFGRTRWGELCCNTTVHTYFDWRWHLELWPQIYEGRLQRAFLLSVCRRDTHMEIDSATYLPWIQLLLKLLAPLPSCQEAIIYVDLRMSNPVENFYNNVFETSDQDGVVGRYTVLPHTTKRKTTTNLKTKNKQLLENQTVWKFWQPRS